MSMLIYTVIAIVVAVLAKLYFVLICGKCTSKRRLDGKTVLLTGGNSGIGYQTAKDLAGRGARVIITSENEQDCIRARDDLIKHTGNSNIVAKYLDLTSLTIVRAFAKDILATEERLDILINNAGTVGLGNNYSKDGLLLGLQVNYFGPFLLTHLLVGLLKKTKSSRIVNVASILSQFGKMNIDNINSCPGFRFSNVTVYSTSKLFIVYMTWEFAARLKDSGVIVNCVHPGAVNTPIFTKQTAWYTPFYLLFKDTYMKTPEQGAQTSIHCAVSEEVEGVTGTYFEDCKPYKPYINDDLATIRAVWDKSIELVKLAPNEIQV